MPIISDPNKMDYQRRNWFLSDPLDAKKIDEITTGLTYVGYTFPGVLDGEPYWLIKRIETTGTVTSIDYSSTNKLFSAIWNDRTGITYY